jgi:hypothetical protein
MDDEKAQAASLAEQLRAQGHEAHAARFSEPLATKTEHGLMAALREACETFLTAVEAVDPKTRFMAEELRLSVEKRLIPKG